MANTKESLDLTGLEADISNILLSNDLKILAILDSDKNVHLVDFQTKKIQDLNIWSDVEKMEFSPDSKYLALVVGDKKLVVLNLDDSLSKIKEYVTDDSVFTSVSWSMGSKYIIAWSKTHLP